MISQPSLWTRFVTRPVGVDFHIAAPDEPTATQVAAAAASLGYRTNIYCDDLDDSSEEISEPWTCECTRTLIPADDDIMGAQAELDAIARKSRAYVDGWGTFGNVADAE